MEVCIVDDNPVVAAQMGRLVAREGVTTSHRFSDPREALRHCEQHPPDLLLIDYNMPGMDGLELLSQLRRQPGLRDVPVVMVTGWAMQGLRDRALQGGAAAVLEKPLEGDGSLQTLRNVLQERRAASVLLGEAPLLQDALELEREAGANADEQYLATLVELANPDPASERISRAVALVCVLVATAVGKPVAFQRCLSRAAPLRNIGKLKRTRWLHADEDLSSADRTAIAQSHVVDGYLLLRKHPSPVMQMAADIALAHHECWDGRGYPFGLKGAQISEAARMVAAAEHLVRGVLRWQGSAPDPVGAALLGVETQCGRMLDPVLGTVLSSLEAELRDLLVGHRGALLPPSVVLAEVDSEAPTLIPT